MDNENKDRLSGAANENFKVIDDLEEAAKDDESLNELVDFVNANLEQAKSAAQEENGVDGESEKEIDESEKGIDGSENESCGAGEDILPPAEEDAVIAQSEGALTLALEKPPQENGGEVALEAEDQLPAKKKRKPKKEKKEKSATNAFDRFFISLWAVIVSVITFIAVQINKIIKLIFKREAPLKYIKAFISTALIICLAFLITAPFRITQQSDQYPIYSNGLIPVKMEVGKDENGVAQYKWGYVDRYGNTKLEAIYDEARPFSNGGAWVRRKEMIEDNGQKVTRDYWSVISLSGRTMSRKFITDATGLDTVGDFDQETNLAWVREGSKYGYVRGYDGKLVVEIIYDDASDFSNSLARVKFGTGEYFINAAGKAKSESYEKVRPFVNGYAAVCRSGGKWGFINTACREIVECKFDEVWDFDGGFAKVRLGTNYGYINQNGKYEVPPNFGDLIPSLD